MEFSKNFVSTVVITKLRTIVVDLNLRKSINFNIDIYTPLKRFKFYNPFLELFLDLFLLKKGLRYVLLKSNEIALS